jgi:flagellar biosynthesis protein
MNLNNLSDDQLNKAVALFYDGENAPTITATGIGEEAQKIIEVAQLHKVPLCDNAQLVDLLVTLELGDSIPEALYIAIAHIIAFAYELQGKAPEGFEP